VVELARRVVMFFCANQIIHPHAKEDEDNIVLNFCSPAGEQHLCKDDNVGSMGPCTAEKLQAWWRKYVSQTKAFDQTIPQSQSYLHVHKHLLNMTVLHLKSRSLSVFPVQLQHQRVKLTMFQIIMTLLQKPSCQN